MANPLSWLAKAGKVIWEVVIGATKLAATLEPEVEIAAPEIAALYSSTVGFALLAEGALGAGTGQQKLVSVTTALMDYAKANGWTATQAEVEQWASAFADSLNKLPFTKAL